MQFSVTSVFSVAKKIIALWLSAQNFFRCCYNCIRCYAEFLETDLAGGRRAE